MTPHDLHQHGPDCDHRIPPTRPPHLVDDGYFTEPEPLDPRSEQLAVLRSAVIALPDVNPTPTIEAGRATDWPMVKRSEVVRLIDFAAARVAGDREDGLRTALDPASRICRRYFTGTGMLCKTHGTDLARCEDWEAGRLASPAPEPRDGLDAEFPMNPEAVEFGRAMGRMEAEREARRVVGRLIVAAGGVIEVPDRLIVADDAEVLMSVDPVAGTTRYAARLQAKDPA